MLRKLAKNVKVQN